MKNTIKPLVIGVTLAAMSSPAMALSWYTPFTVFEDDNLDFVVDNGDGVLSIGDRLISVAEFNNTQGILAGQGPSAIIDSGVEITAVADVTIIAAVETAAGSGEFNFVFGASGAAGLLSGYAAGTALVAFSDASPDLDVINANCGTRASCLTLAGLGLADGSTEFLSAGFFGDLDASWVSSSFNSGATIAVVEGGNASTKFGSFNFSLDIGINNTGWDLVDQNCSPFCTGAGDSMIALTGSGDILGGQGLADYNEWTARSDTDVQVAPIPEPVTLGLLGAGLLAFGGLRRKKA